MRDNIHSFTSIFLSKNFHRWRHTGGRWFCDASTKPWGIGMWQKVGGGLGQKAQICGKSLMNGPFSMLIFFYQGLIVFFSKYLSLGPLTRAAVTMTLNPLGKSFGLSHVRVTLVLGSSLALKAMDLNLRPQFMNLTLGSSRKIPKIWFRVSLRTVTPNPEWKKIMDN